MPVQLGVQLYSLREEIASDLEGVIRRLAEIGYAGVEPYQGLDAAQVTALCQRYGLAISSAHLAMPLGDAQATVLADAAQYGITRVVVPWQPSEIFTAADSIKTLADQLNAASLVCQQNGLTLGYHNHDFEFTVVDGRPGYDMLLEYLSPDVFLEVDVYWAQTAGHDPAALVQRLGQRAPLLHLKDGPATRGVPMTALGDGVVDIKAVVAVSNADWHLVEIDSCATDMMQAIERSYTYMIESGLAAPKP